MQSVNSGSSTLKLHIATFSLENLDLEKPGKSLHYKSGLQYCDHRGLRLRVNLYMTNHCFETDDKYLESELRQ